MKRHITIEIDVDANDDRLCGACPKLDKLNDVCREYGEELDATWDDEVESSPTIYERCAQCLRAEQLREA